MCCLTHLQYMPTIGDMYTKDVEVNGAPRHVEIDDTAGQVRCLSVATSALGNLIRNDIDADAVIA